MSHAVVKFSFRTQGGCIEQSWRFSPSGQGLILSAPENLSLIAEMYSSMVLVRGNLSEA